MSNAPRQAQTYRRRLRELALDNHGYVTTDDAVAAGIPAVELRKLTNRGGLRNVAYGLYRFDDIPSEPHRDFAEAVLQAGPGAFLYADAVLALLGLGLVNPRKIRVGTPRRVRRKLSQRVELVEADVPESDLTVYDGVRSEKLSRALIDSVGTVMSERLIDAAEQGFREGYLRKGEFEDVLQAIGAKR